MFNNRMLAVAAVLVMAVPALGAATPIVVPPVPEQLVEGHTVFTVVEIVRQTTVTQVRFAAAVAVLVREVNKERRAERFPGVLWFNDQYLVNPESARRAVDNFRYPCGGAVMAVNAGDPDPRIAIARLSGQTVGASNLPGPLPPSVSATTPSRDIGETNHTYSASDYWVKPTPGTYYYGQDSGGPGDAPTDYAWIGAKPGVYNVDASDPTQSTINPGQVYSDTVNPFDYRESYLITDPNDHSWVIDQYRFYTRVGLDTEVDASTTDVDTTVTPPAVTPPDVTATPSVTTVYSYYVWVVNILGSPVFTTDGDLTGLPSCAAFVDVIPDSVTVGPLGPGGEVPQTTVPVGNAIDQVTCGQDAFVGHPAVYKDDPCMSYMEPSSNGYCYGGQPALDYDGDGGVDKDDCVYARQGGDKAAKPFRYYNALLYFQWEDLTDKGGAARDHNVGSTDTNGCSEEQYWWGPNPPLAADQYECPGDDDNREGNSHPFHPTTPPHIDEEKCPDEMAGPNPTNHGGSTTLTGPADANGWYNGTKCDYFHAVADIDIYFSPGGRPFPPVVPNFVVTDLQGSSAPFNGKDTSPAGH